MASFYVAGSVDATGRWWRVYFRGPMANREVIDAAITDAANRYGGLASVIREMAKAVHASNPNLAKPWGKTGETIILPDRIDLESSPWRVVIDVAPIPLTVLAESIPADWPSTKRILTKKANELADDGGLAFVVYPPGMPGELVPPGFDWQLAAADTAANAEPAATKPADLCTTAVALSEFQTSSRTIQRAVIDGRLRNYGDAKSKTYLLSRAELSMHFTKKASPKK